MGHLCQCSFFKHTAFRLLFITGENASSGGHYVENQCSVAENLLYPIVLACSLFLLFPLK